MVVVRCVSSVSVAFTAVVLRIVAGIAIVIPVVGRRRDRVWGYRTRKRTNAAAALTS